MDIQTKIETKLDVLNVNLDIEMIYQLFLNKIILNVYNMIIIYVKNVKMDIIQTVTIIVMLYYQSLII